MSNFSVASTVLFSSLGLIGLAIGWLARCYSRPALLTGLAGLLSLTAASTWMAVAGPQVVTDPRAQKIIAGLTDELAKVKADLARSKQEAGDLKKQLSEARAEVEKWKGEAMSKGVAPPTTPAPILQPAILDELDKEPDTPFYTVRRDQHPERVAGHKGRWYSVRLKQSGLKQSGDPLQFSDRELALDHEAIRASTLELRALVERARTLGPKLFVRGLADPRPVAGPIRGLTPTTLSVLPQTGDCTNGSFPMQVAVPTPGTNEHLPTLRANELRKLVQSVFGSADIPILENQRRGSERTAELLLFIDWPTKP